LATRLVPAVHPKRLEHVQLAAPGAGSPSAASGRIRPCASAACDTRRQKDSRAASAGTAASIGLAALTASAAAQRRRAAKASRAELTRRRGVAVATATPTDEEVAQWERFSTWITARGGDISSVVMGQPGGIRGLVATKDIAEGESIIEIPLGASIELSNSESAKDPSQSALTLLRLYREARDGDPQPYFDLLPAMGSPDLATMPDFFSDSELEMMQCPTAVEKTRRRGQLCAKRAEEHGFSTDEVKWALCSVTMRSFTVLSPVDGLLRLLLPGIDLLNHDSDAPHRFRVRWNMHGVFDGLFKVVAGREVKKGEEVRICYGGNPYRAEGCGGDCSGDIAWTNEQYLQRYGFVDKSLGTTMVDGRWLVSEAAASVREAMSQTTAAEDEALLEDSQLAPALRVAIELRLHMKRALVAQREVEAASVAAGEDETDKDDKGSVLMDASGHYSKEAVLELAKAAELAKVADSGVDAGVQVSPS